MNARFETGTLSVLAPNEVKTPLFTRRQVIFKAADLALKGSVIALAPAVFFERKSEQIQEQIDEAEERSLQYQSSPTMVSRFDQEISDLEEKQELPSTLANGSLGVAVGGASYITVKWAYNKLKPTLPPVK